MIDKDFGRALGIALLVAAAVGLTIFVGWIWNEVSLLISQGN